MIANLHQYGKFTSMWQLEEDFLPSALYCLCVYICVLQVCVCVCMFVCVCLCVCSYMQYNSSVHHDLVTASLTKLEYNQ